MVANLQFRLPDESDRGQVDLLLADKYKIYYLVVNDRHLVQDFIDGLPKLDQEKIFSLLKFSAKNGPPKNKEKFKQLHCKERDIYEFKQKPYRILCAFNGETKIILSHGFKKGKPKKQQNEINRALKLFKQYFEGNKNENGQMV